MRIGFIGAGKVGRALGCYYKTKGYPVQGYISRRKESATLAVKETGGGVYTGLQQLALDCDMIFITTPDDTIKVIADELSQLGIDWQGRIVVHTSGAHSSALLSSLSEQGGTVCSMHPMLSFGDPIAVSKALTTAPLTIEGSGPVFDLFKNFVQSLGNPWITIDAVKKVQYHAAACMVSNYLVTLLDIGLKMLKDVGFDEEQAVNQIKSLAQGTVENVMNLGSEKALTGPISRGDIGTIKSHVSHFKCQQWLDVYRILGRETAALAAEAGRIDDDMEMKVKEVLKFYG